MGIDKEGFEIIDKGFQDDMAAQAAKRKAEIEKEHKNDKYVGPPNMQTEDQGAVSKLKAQKLEEAEQQDKAFYEQAHFGKFGREHLLKEAEREEKIKAAQQRWRDQASGKIPTPEKSSDPEKLSNKFDKEATAEERKNALKEKWRQADENKGKEREHEK